MPTLQVMVCASVSGVFLPQVSLSYLPNSVGRHLDDNDVLSLKMLSW